MLRTVTPVTAACWEEDQGKDAVRDAIGEWSMKIGNFIVNSGGGGSRPLLAAGGLFTILGTILGSMADDYCGSFVFDYPSIVSGIVPQYVERAEPPSGPVSDDIIVKSGIWMHGLSLSNK